MSIIISTTSRTASVRRCTSSAVGLNRISRRAYTTCAFWSSVNMFLNAFRQIPTVDSSYPRNFASGAFIFWLSPLYWSRNIWIIICEMPWSLIVETLLRTISSTRIAFLLTTMF